MPRKDKKKKIKPKKKQYKIIPPKLKPCEDCGYKSGLAFRVPFGYADLLGTQRLGSSTPIININLAKQYEERFAAPIPIKNSMESQTEPMKPIKKIYPTVPYIPLEESSFSIEPVRKDIKIGVEPFVGFEDIYNSPFERATNVSTGTTAETISGVSEIAPPARRVRRTDVEVVADLIVKNEGKSYDEAIATAVQLSKTKGALKNYKKSNK